MTDIQAAIALEQLKKLVLFNSKRLENARLLDKGLQNIHGIKIPAIVPGHVFHQYTIMVDDFHLSRDELQAHLQNNGISSAIFYPLPLHLHPFYKRQGYSRGDFPVAEQVAKQVLSLPVHPSLSKGEIQRIIEAIQNA
jgi:perosamine synthetase